MYRRTGIEKDRRKRLPKSVKGKTVSLSGSVRLPGSNRDREVEVEATIQACCRDGGYQLRLDRKSLNVLRRTFGIRARALVHVSDLSLESLLAAC